MTTSAAQEIQLIQIARSTLKLDEETYRNLLSNLAGGKTSSKDLTPAERQTVLNHFKSRGFVVKPKAVTAATAWQREPQMQKLRAMWYVLADAGHVERPADMTTCNLSIEAWAKRQLAGTAMPLDAMRFASGPQMAKLVESLKRWLDRLNVPTH